MSSKPIDTGRWAQTAGGTPATNLTAISTGQADTGWTLGQKPPSGIANTLGTIAYLWHKWLDDGDCTFHNLSATGTLGVTGNATVGGTLGVTGNVTFGGTLSAGAATINGTATIAGLLSANGGITVPTGKSVTLNGTTTFTVGTGAAILGGNLTVAGTIKEQAIRTIIVPVVPAKANAGGNTSATLVGTIDTWGLTLEVGKRIVAARAFVTLDGGSPNWKLTLNGNVITSNFGTLASSTANTTTGASTMSLTSSVDVQAGHGYALYLEQTAAGNGIGGPTIQGLEIDIVDP